MQERKKIREEERKNAKKSERKNVSQMARDSVEVTYHKLHHFLTESTWSAAQINERRARGNEQMQSNQNKSGI